MSTTSQSQTKQRTRGGLFKAWNHFAMYALLKGPIGAMSIMLSTACMFVLPS